MENYAADEVAVQNPFALLKSVAVTLKLHHHPRILSCAQQKHKKEKKSHDEEQNCHATVWGVTSLAKHCKILHGRLSAVRLAGKTLESKRPLRKPCPGPVSGYRGVHRGLG